MDVYVKYICMIHILNTLYRMYIYMCVCISSAWSQVNFYYFISRSFSTEKSYFINMKISK